MPEGVVVRADENDPRRCTAVSGTRQCIYLAAEGFQCCNYHNSGQRLAAKKDQQRQYLLKNWRNEINHYADHPQIKCLREEIGILKLLMQETLNRCTDANELFMYSPRIIELTSRIEGIVQTCHRMEEKTQFMVDKNQIVTLAEQILLIISMFVNDPIILAKIAEKIQQAIESKATVHIVDGEVKEIPPG